MSRFQQTQEAKPERSGLLKPFCMGDLGNWTIPALELIFPSTCRLCDACIDSARYFCSSCELQLNQTRSLMDNACLRCGRPGGKQSDAGACQNCAREKFHYDGCVSLWAYEGIVRNTIVAAKYGSQLALAEALGVRLAARLSSYFQRDLSEFQQCDFVTGVPSHFLRRVQRGFGGGGAIARTVTWRLQQNGAKLRYHALLRNTRYVRKQAWMSEKDRLSNVSGAFQVVPRFGKKSNRLKGRHLLVVDDVLTTGATANEVSRVLKQAGAARVTVAVVARALGH